MWMATIAIKAKRNYETDELQLWIIIKKKHIYVYALTPKCLSRINVSRVENSKRVSSMEFDCEWKIFSWKHFHCVSDSRVSSRS